jgi:outer membrane protein assembly factor BamA
MRIIAIVCAFGFFTCFNIPSATAQVKAAPSARISEIAVKGAISLTKASIISSSGLAIGQPFSQAALDTAAKQLRNLGVFGFGAKDPADAVKVSSEVKAKKARITIQVIENPVVKSFVFDGAGPIDPTDLTAVMQSKPGSVLDLHKLQHDLVAIHDEFETNGYQAIIGDEIGVKDGILTIPVALSKIRELKLVGIRQRDQDAMMKLIKSQKGGYYNVKQLKVDLTELLKTGYFRAVEPAFAFPAPGQVEVTITVRER